MSKFSYLEREKKENCRWNEVALRQPYKQDPMFTCAKNMATFLQLSHNRGQAVNDVNTVSVCCVMKVNY